MSFSLCISGDVGGVVFVESEAVAVFVGDAFVRGAIVLLFLAVNARIESLLSGWVYFVYLYSNSLQYIWTLRR